MSKKKDEKILELQYTVEALEDEIDHWKVVADEKQRRIVELITENDRLTLTYEPYEPPKSPRFKYDRFWQFSFEFWPGAWNLSYYRYQWEKYGSKSREGSIYVGPFGFSWNREPKSV